MTELKCKSRLELEKRLKKNFGKIGMYKTRIYFYTALAKKSTPYEHLAIGNTKSVHIGLYIPSTKQCFIFYNMKKYVKNLPVK